MYLFGAVLRREERAWHNLSAQPPWDSLSLRLLCPTSCSSSRRAVSRWLQPEGCALELGVRSDHELMPFLSEQCFSDFADEAELVLFRCHVDVSNIHIAADARSCAVSGVAAALFWRCLLGCVWFAFESLLW